MGEEQPLEEFDQELLIGQLLEDPEITQFSTRSLRDGLDTLCCYQRCIWKGAPARLIVHFPFYPPFQRLPEVQVNLLDSDLGRLRVTDRQKFGVRAEISLGPVSEGPVGQSGFWIECLAQAGWSQDGEDR